MNKIGFFRVAAAFTNVKIADTRANLEYIEEVINSTSDDVELLVFPELCITGYTCGDLFHMQTLLDNVEKTLSKLADATQGRKLLLFVGAPLLKDGRLYNCAIAISDGRIQGVVPKIHLPNYNEFYEKRWFSSGVSVEGDLIEIDGVEYPFGCDLLFSHRGATIGAELCEDLWVPIPPSAQLTQAGADIIVNLSATDELYGKHNYLLNLLRSTSARYRCAYVYSSAGYGESSTDAVFAGNAIIVEDGSILKKSPRFSYNSETVVSDIDLERIRHDRMHFETYHCQNHKAKMRIVKTGIANRDNQNTDIIRNVNPHPFVPPMGAALDECCQEVTSIQTAGLVQRLKSTNCKALTIGVSGGLDSTLALLVAVKAFDTLGLPRTGIHAISMPGFGTTKRTRNNASTIMSRLGVSHCEICINDSVMQHFKDIGHDPSVQNVTYENSQARERTQILMDYANRIGGMVLGTGDLSELALGWCTYNADHMSMYGVNSSVPKTLVRHLVTWIAEREKDVALRDALLDIVDTPVSPELIPADENGNIAQKTEDLVGPYELHDFYLYNMLRFGFSPTKIYCLAQKAFADKYDNGTLKHWLRTFIRRFFNQQFKRSCLPDGPKIGNISISPRADWRMPSDATSALWLAEVDDL